MKVRWVVYDTPPEKRLFYFWSFFRNTHRVREVGGWIFRLCCGIKHTKSENLPPYAPQSSGFDLLSLFSSGVYPPLSDGYRAATRPSGRERNQDAPQKGASIPAMRPVKSTQEGTFVWFGARGARKFKFSHFFGAAASGQERQALTYLPAHKGATQPELRRVWRSAKETCL